MQYLFIIFLIVLSLLPFMFAFPSLFIRSIHIEKVSFCITNYMPFRFSICFSCTEENFLKLFSSFFLLHPQILRRKEDSKCSLDQVHFHTFFITKFLSSYELALFLMVDFPHSRLDIIKMNLASLSASFAWRLFFVPRFFARTSKK